MGWAYSLREWCGSRRLGLFLRGLEIPGCALFDSWCYLCGGVFVGCRSGTPRCCGEGVVGVGDGDDVDGRALFTST